MSKTQATKILKGLLPHYKWKQDPEVFTPMDNAKQLHINQAMDKLLALYRTDDAASKTPMRLFIEFAKLPKKQRMQITENLRKLDVHTTDELSRQIATAKQNSPHMAVGHTQVISANQLKRLFSVLWPEFTKNDRLAGVKRLLELYGKTSQQDQLEALPVFTRFLVLDVGHQRLVEKRMNKRYTFDTFSESLAYVISDPMCQRHGGDEMLVDRLALFKSLYARTRTGEDFPAKPEHPSDHWSNDPYYAYEAYETNTPSKIQRGLEDLGKFCETYTIDDFTNWLWDDVLDQKWKAAKGNILSDEDKTIALRTLTKWVEHYRYEHLN